MLLGRGTLALLLAVVLGSARWALATPIYLIDTDEVGFNDLFLVDQTSGQLTPIGALPDPTVVGAILALAAADDNTLYAVAENGPVFQITVNPFSFTTIGDIGPNGVVGLGFASDGNMYMTDEFSNLLSLVTPSPFSVSMIGTIHVGDPGGAPFIISGGDLAQDASGNWFIWTNAIPALFQLDVTQAVATPVPSQVVGSSVRTGIAFDYDGGGTLLSSSSPLHALVTLDPASGADVASVDYCLNCPTVYQPQFGDLASPLPASTTTSTSTTTFTTSTTTITSTTVSTTSTTSTTLLPPACAAAPLPGCVPPAVRRSSLILKSGRPSLSWQWKSGASVALGDFGSPATSTTLALCLYDQAGLRLTKVPAPGALCGTRPCWRATASAIHYRNSHALDGIVSVTIRAANGTARIAVRGRGAGLNPPPTPLSLPVRMQLVREDGGCWDASFDTFSRNDTSSFVAKSD